jgi:3-dehydroquinate dehydratase II
MSPTHPEGTIRQAGPVLLLSGPNLNLLGERQPEIYGTTTLDELVGAAAKRAADHGLDLEHHQSNHEGELVGFVQGARGRCAAIVVNPGALTHYGWSLHDALAAFDGPIIELHLSNPAAREPWRHTSVVAPVASGTVAGFGALGYLLAVDAVAALLGDASSSGRETS